MFLVLIYYSASFILLQVSGAVDLGQIWQWQQNICQWKNNKIAIVVRQGISVGWRRVKTSAFCRSISAAVKEEAASR